MRWRRLALRGGAALGAMAVLNEIAAYGVRALANPLGGTEGTWHWRGHRIAWTRRGRGPALLLVHDVHPVAWSHEWRRVVAPLAAGHTVWTVDLLGFGRSDRPAVRYGAALMVALLDAFTREVVAAPCTLVGAGVGGAYATALAARDARRFPALVLASPRGVAHRIAPPAAADDARRLLLATPLAGASLFNAIVSRPALRLALRRAYADPRHVTRALVDAAHATAHQPGARHAAAACVGRALDLHVRDALRRLEQPVLLTWGEQARDLPPAEPAAWRACCPNAEVRTFSHCGSRPHDERAAAWCAAVREFLARRAAPAAVDA
jgi:pimeloyl-ACP methyl ester carboxylesterase